MSDGLAGTIPAFLGNLSNLETLKLRGNSLSGKQPEGVCVYLDQHECMRVRLSVRLVYQKKTEIEREADRQSCRGGDEGVGCGWDDLEAIAGR